MRTNKKQLADNFVYDSRGPSVVHLNAPELSHPLRRSISVDAQSIVQVKRSVPVVFLLGLILPIFLAGLFLVDSNSYKSVKAAAETSAPASEKPISATPDPSSDPNSTAPAAITSPVPLIGKTYSVTLRVADKSKYVAFESSTLATLNDKKSWSRVGLEFRQIASDGDFEIVLADPELLPTYSENCSVEYSCRVGNLVIINAKYWLSSRQELGITIPIYRQMVINHEVGHWLGLEHSECPLAGQLAPVMMQQSIGLNGCTPNAWPLDAEIELVKSLQIN